MTRRRIKRRRDDRGMTVTEMALVVLLGGLMMTALYQVYSFALNNSVDYRNTAESSTDHLRGVLSASARSADRQPFCINPEVAEQFSQCEDLLQGGHVLLTPHSEAVLPDGDTLPSDALCLPVSDRFGTENSDGDTRAVDCWVYLEDEGTLRVVSYPALNLSVPENTEQAEARESSTDLLYPEYDWTAPVQQANVNEIAGIWWECPDTTADDGWNECPSNPLPSSLLPSSVGENLEEARRVRVRVTLACPSGSGPRGCPEQPAGWPDVWSDTHPMNRRMFFTLGS